MQLRPWLLAPAVLLSAALAQSPDRNADMHELIEAMEAGQTTSEAAIHGLLHRIEAQDGTTQSVLAIDPGVLGHARAADERRGKGDALGPLHGVPILIKDNIETEGLPTTAGSLALSANASNRDAPAVAKLRAAGAIVLGKTNLSEWANFRSTDSVSGWSALGGQTRNPYSLDRTPCGSSSGSGAAVAAGFAPAALGTETNGSVICPANANGIVGFKPTVGLVSRTHVVPISPTQDTIGPMTRSVRDAALLLSVMAGSDPADSATAEADAHLPTAQLPEAALDGVRIGVLRFAEGDDPRVSALFEAALTVLQSRGAELVDLTEWEAPDTLWADEFLVLQAEFKTALGDYLATTPETVPVRTLADLIAFNDEHAEQELPLFGQDIFEMADATGGMDDPAYKEALARMLSGVRTNGIEALLGENDVALLVAPTGAPAFLIDPVAGDQYEGGIGAGWMAATAGTPHLTVPMGAVQGLPVGLSFLGAKWDDGRVLAAGADYEDARGPLPAPRFAASAFESETLRDALRRDEDPLAGVDLGQGD